MIPLNEYNIKEIVLTLEIIKIQEIIDNIIIIFKKVNIYFSSKNEENTLNKNSEIPIMISVLMIIQKSTHLYYKVKILKNHPFQNSNLYSFPACLNRLTY